MFACTHPGKIGDAIYALPTIKKLSEMTDSKADFYTSSYCAPLKNLFEYQSYINRFYVSPNYVIERMDMGIQPYRVPVDISLYTIVYHLGFRYVPDRPLHEFIATYTPVEEVGRPVYAYPDFETSNEPYLVVSPKGETGYTETFNEFIQYCTMDCVIVGGEGEYTGFGIDKTGLDFLDTVTWIAKSKGFLGMPFSQLTLANGFDIPKVAVHDGIHWDMRHVIQSETNFYPINPTARELLEIFNL